LENGSGLFQLTFPHGDDVPAEFSKLTGMFPVIGNIALKFLLPELDVGFGGGGVFAAVM